MSKKKKKQNQEVAQEAVALETPVEIPIESTVDMAQAIEVMSSETAAVEAMTEALEAEAMQAAEHAENATEDKPVVDKSMLCTDRRQIESVLEAIIFAAPRSISVIRLKNLLTAHKYDTDDMLMILDEMVEASKERGVQLMKVGRGFQYRTNPEHAEVMQKLLEDKPMRLSQSALEVLAIVAYKQPVTRAEIDAVRGVDSGHLMKGLLEKNLVRTTGHAETPGSPLLYGTSPYFLEVFSLNAIEDLPDMEDFERELAAGKDQGSEDDASVLAPEPGLLDGLLDRASPLAAEPDRGAFDNHGEDVVEDADFGVADRAREEVENNVN